MPGRMRRNSACDHIYLETDRKPCTNGTMGDIRIAVQPPERTQAGTCLWPPIIAEQTVRDADSGVDYFATAAVMDRQGSVVDGHLAGTKAASRSPIAASKPGRETFVFPFTDLAISQPGAYVIRVDVYKFLQGDPAGATLVEQLETNVVCVGSSPVSPGSPSTDEQSLLRRVRDAGISMATEP
ncbi:hypothetical protein HIM_04142 [Hirsutella minnesotensis 3608]|uniref:Velvet domain-containing protein n=1 Tax=Hirsutella minnesotensis 3608 TaxID=1043627 RepID=A0A0F7ZVD3_9HYPO|nr:hypothetical protein HIM_04142 [Hirsutella minnesotensis 3608]